MPDGTVVFFFTTLGRIEPQGKTKDGVARVNLVADSRSGIAKVTAATGNVVSDAQEVAIGSKLPTKMVVTANPPYLAGAREATITANVFDDNGNPVQNVPVIFTVEPVGTAPLREVLASGGSPQYTDSNGQAFDTLATRTANGVSVKTVTVTATTANLLTESVSVIVNYSAVTDGFAMRLSLLALALLSLTGTSARAEIALLSSGLTLKLDGHRVEDGLVVLALKGGGEMGVPPAAVRGFVPDEVLDEVTVPAGGDLREPSPRPPRGATASTRIW